VDRFALIDHPLLLVLQLVCLVHLKRVLLPAALGLLLLCVIPLCYFMPLDGCRHCGGSCSSSSSVLFFFFVAAGFPEARVEEDGKPETSRASSRQ